LRWALVDSLGYAPCFRGGSGYLPSETRREYVHVGSEKTSLFFTVSEDRYPVSPLGSVDSYVKKSVNSYGGFCVSESPDPAGTWGTYPPMTVACREQAPEYRDVRGRAKQEPEPRAYRDVLVACRRGISTPYSRESMVPTPNNHHPHDRPSFCSSSQAFNGAK